MPPAPDADDDADAARAHALGTAHGRSRARDDGRGAVYTPPDVARALAHDALALAPGLPRVLDPACGAGAPLIEAARMLWARAGAATPEARLDVLRGRIRGWDVDPGAVEAARRALALAAGAPDAALDEVVRLRDGLAPGEEGTFDVVLGNPPWVDAAAHAARDPEGRAALAARFATARGAWDLFCVFAERALSLLRPGGVHAFVVPDRLATAPFAAPLRRLLHGDGRRLAGLRVLDGAGFDAAVRPLAYVVVAGDDAPVPVAHGARVHPVRLPRDGGPWPLPVDDADDALLAALADLPRLDASARVCGAATVAEAYALRDALVDGTPDAARRPAVNTGTVDPLRSRWGERPLRYLGRALLRPVVPLDALPPRRRAQALAPKLVVGGIGKRLEPFADLRGGVVALKSTVLVLPHDDAELAWLGAWLASSVATRAWRVRSGGLRLRGDHLRVGPPELAALPVPRPSPAERARLDALGRALVARPDDEAAWAALDALAIAVLGLPPGPPG